MILIICWKDHSGCTVENGPDGTGLEASRDVLGGSGSLKGQDHAMVVSVGIESKYGVRKKEESRMAPRSLPRTAGAIQEEMMILVKAS